MKAYNGFTADQRNKAQAWLNKQWANGELKRPTHCHACGQTKGIIDAHAEDYSLPFEAGKTDEYHLCYRCHMMVHCRYRNWTAWCQYRDNVRAGVRYAPFYSRSFPRFAAEHLDKWEPRIDVDGFTPKRDVLSEIEIYGKTRLGRAQG